MNWSALFGVLLAFALSQNTTSFVRLQVAPTQPPPPKFTQVGVSIFDLQIGHGGAVDNDSLLYGQPPFIERSRLSFGAWRFEEAAKECTNVNATFLYQPQLDLP